MAGNTAIDRFVIEKVIAMRKEKRMSQAVLAAKMEVSSSFIGDIENPENRSKYNIIHINNLAKIFGCSPKDFLPEQPI